MSIKLIRIQETTEGFVKQGEDEYLKRIDRFANMDVVTIRLPKKFNHLSPQELKMKEAEKILSNLQTNDFVVLLDEKGKQLSSLEFAQFLEEKLAFGGGNLIFVIGGAYGFAAEIYQRTNFQLSFSKMTTTHQLIRLFFLEQLYRAFTIIQNHPYHNE